MEKIRKVSVLLWFDNLKIGQKIILAFLMSSIVPIVAVQTIGYYVNSNLLKNRIDQLMVNNLTQISERVNLTMEIYSNLVYQIYMDDKIIENVSLMMEEGEGQEAVAYRIIYKRLQQADSTVGGIRAISIIGTDGSQVTYDRETGSAIDNLWGGVEDYRTILPYINAQERDGLVTTPTIRFEEAEEEHYYFHISKPMYDYKNLEKGPIATIVMSIDERVLNNICSIPNEKQEAQYNINFITDQDGYVITYPDAFYTGIRMNPKLSVEEFVEVTGLLKHQKTAVNKYVDETSGWVFYNVYDYDYMLQDIARSQMFFVGISVAALVLACSLIFYTVKKIGSSVHKIIVGIQEVQRGNLEVQVQVDSRDEMGQIAHNFNEMTEKVKQSIREVSDAKDKQKDAEIRALEAQINPHFLYNTLDSINWMAIEKDEYEISNMIHNLGVILRYSVNKSNQMATIDELTDWLDKYVSLQQMRFDQSFTYHVNVDERVRKARVYKLLIQPFIENSIIHGFKDMNRGGMIRVDIGMSSEETTIDVILEDNGKGMKPEMVSIFNNRETAVCDDGRSIGLHNAFARMQMYYGEEAGWNVTSIEEMGTVVTLKIPIRRSDV